MKTPAIAYLRTSSAANVGGDSDQRQREAIQAYAARNGLELVREFYDAAVSGADPIEDRPGFAALLDYAEAEGVKVLVVEDSSRFARQMIPQEVGVLALMERGIKLVTASGHELTDESDPAKVLMRQIAGAFAQYEKARLVLKLKGARDRASQATGKRVEGRKGYDDTNPELVREAKRLGRKNPKTGKVRSLREIAGELAALGHTTATGKPFSAAQVKRLLDY